MSVGLSVGLSVCLSVPNEFYRSVMLMLVYICCYYCCCLYLKNVLLSYFAYLAAVAALQFKMSVSSKFHTSYNVVIMFVYVINVTNDLDDAFMHKKVINHNST